MEGGGINIGPGPDENHLHPLIFFNLVSSEDTGFWIMTSASWLIVSGQFNLLHSVCRLITMFSSFLYVLPPPFQVPSETGLLLLLQLPTPRLCWAAPAQWTLPGALSPWCLGVLPRSSPPSPLPLPPSLPPSSLSPY